MSKFDGELLEMPAVLPIAYKCVKAENHLEGHSPGEYHTLLQYTQDGLRLLTVLIFANNIVQSHYCNNYICTYIFMRGREAYSGSSKGPEVPQNH